MAHWEKYLRDSIPDYLAKHYWWAYLSRAGVWFFDHPWIINTILFGKYRVLMSNCLEMLAEKHDHNSLDDFPENEISKSNLLQVASVYGSLTPNLLRHLQHDLYLVDVARIQLRATKKKINPIGHGRSYMQQMNAERLGFRDQSFNNVLLFFLLHEMPQQARINTLQECVRVIKPGGRLVIVDYGELTSQNFIHRSSVMRKVIGFLEPFLPGFWSESLRDRIGNIVSSAGRDIRMYTPKLLYNGFYRIVEVIID